MSMNPVVHFEMPYHDKQRIAEFYSNAFGWKAEMLGPEMGEYITVQTSKTGDDGFPEKPGMINGGFFKKDESMPDQIPSVVIAVHDIADTMKKVEAAGGKVLGNPMEIPGVGSYVSFRDTEGNRVSILQPLQM